MRYIFILLAFCVCSFSSRSQLVLNEVSQGPSGTKEYIELVVTGIRTCTDSTADLRGWIIDDNNGWIASGSGQGIATGCMRFANAASWQKVPYGSIILIYNDGDKNSSITLADDPADADHDYVYIVPASSALLERHTSSPVSPSSAGYVYPSTGFVSGGSWNTVGLANTGDGVVITSPADLTRAYFSFGFGIGSAATATVQKPNMAAGRNYYLNDGAYTSAASWVLGTVPTNETPGQPNTTANRSWILSLRITPPGTGPVTDIDGCIKLGETYNFNGNSLTSGGYYTTTISRPGLCDSTVNLYLVVGVPLTQAISGCESVVFNGVTYTASTQLKDTIRSLVTGCDSIFRTTNIQVLSSPVSQHTACIKLGESYSFNGNNLTIGGYYSATISRPGLCDSIASLYLVVSTERSSTIEECDKVVYGGITYTTSTLVRDTIRSQITACDSIYTIVNIIIKEKPLLTVNPAAVVCKDSPFTLSAAAPGSSIQWLTLGTTNPVTVYPQGTTTYSAVATGANGCTDTAHVTVTVADFELLLTADQNPVQAGQPVLLHSQAAGSYSMLEWLPRPLFPAQTAIEQRLVSDTSVTVLAIARSADGCVDTARLLVRVTNDNNDLFVPNVFSPNNDGRNDLFRVFGTTISSIDLQVFNQWGEMIFRTSDRNGGWDGTVRGKPQPVGVYIYVLKATLTNGTVVNKKGSVNLIR